MAERKVTFLINANVRNFTKGMNSASKRFKKFGRNMERMGRNLTRSITAPALAAGAGAVKMASDFESSMTKIETLVGLSRDQVQGMRKDVLKLARGTGKAPQELSEALFTVTSAGLRGANAMQVLERASKASAIGLGNTRDIAQATTAIMQAYGEDVMSASLATDTLTAIVREGNLEASELAPTLGRVVGIASQLGISFQEVGASIATFTRLGVSSEEAVTGLRGVMNALLKPTRQGDEALKSIGLTFEDLRKRVQDEGLMDTLRMLVERFDGNDEALSQLIPNVRALSAVLGTAGAQGEAYEKILGNIQKATGIVDEGFEKVSETTEFKFNKALASLKASTIELGTILLPVANKIIERIQLMAEWFGKLSTESLMFALKITAITAAAGPALIILGKLSKLIAFMVSPTFLAAAAITALFSAVVVGSQWLVDNSAKIFQGLINVTDSVVIAFQEMGRGVMIALKKLMNFILTKIPPVLVAETLGFDVTEWAANISGINSAIDSMTETIDEGRKNLQEGISKYNKIEWGSLSDSAKRAFELTKNAVIQGLQGILNSSEIQGLIEKMNSMFSVSPQSGSVKTSKPDIKIASVNRPIQNLNQDISDMKVNLSGVSNPIGKFNDKMDLMKAKALEMGQALQSSVSSAITSFSETLGNAFTGDAGAKGFFNNILLIVADFGSALGKALIAAGVAAQAFQFLLTNPIGAIIAGTALVAASTVVKNLLKEGPKAQGMAHGGIVPSGFPNDSYPAMLSSGETVIPAPKPLPSMGMNQRIEVPVYLNDREIARGISDFSKTVGR